MIDPTTLNPVAQADQHTAFTLAPVCVRCGHGGLSLRRGGVYRCDGCQRVVESVEFAPTVASRPPSRRLRSWAGGL